jgi:hypothetical protein
MVEDLLEHIDDDPALHGKDLLEVFNRAREAGEIFVTRLFRSFPCRL